MKPVILQKEHSGQEMPSKENGGHSRLKFLWMLVLVVLASLFGATKANAQTETATLSGLVTDASGAIVPGAELQLQSVNKGFVRTTTTNSAGIYVFSAIQPGQYQITIRKSGFKQVDFLGLILNTQDHIEQNFRLEVGSVSESITVGAADPTSQGITVYGEGIDVNPAVSTVVTRDFVENMPLNGRSFQDLISLAPGTVTSTTSSYGGFSINGQRDDANYFMVDGVSANVYSGTTNLPGQGLAGTVSAQTALGTTQALVSVDALEEFRIQTSGYTADTGRQPGGQVQLTTRSGTNEWHGSVFDYFRNTVFDANNWFSNQQGIPRQPEHQNDFGGTLGGPIRIPHLYNGKDKTFFFFSYEGLRLLLPNFVQTIVPTAAFRQSANPAVQPFLNAFPIANGVANLTDGCTVPTSTGTAPCDAQFNAGYSNPNTLDSVSIRIDHNWGEKLRLFGRYATTPSNAAVRSQNNPSNITTTITNTKSVTLGVTSSPAKTVANDIRFNYSLSDTSNNLTLDSFGGAVPFAASLINPPQYIKGGASEADVGLCISGSALCNGSTLANHIIQQHQYNVVDALSWTPGNHGFKFGVDYRRLLPVYNFVSYDSALDFASLADVQQGVVGDFILAAKPVYPAFTNVSLYAEDHWKVNSRLTVDYGLRWEFNPVPGEASGIIPLAVTQISDLATMQLAPQGTAAYHTEYLNFAPRVGFAWNAPSFRNHALVVRGGFGIYYDTGQAIWALAYSDESPPFGAFYDVANVSLPISAAAVPPPNLNAPLVPPYNGLNLMDPHLKLPYTNQYNLSVDLGVSARNTLTVSYVGNQGHRLLETQQYSQFLNPNFLFPSITDNAGSSSYNALQVQDRGYVAPGLQLIASYTWAHALDNVSTDFNAAQAPVRGNSNNDVREVLSTALNYEIPSTVSNRFLHALTRGWLFANRFTAETGYPFDVIQGQYFGPRDQTFNIYPDLVSGVQIYRHNVPGVPGGWELNSAAFSPVPLNPDGSPVRQGDLPRNFLRGPAFWNMNTAIERTFPIHEGLRLIFRAEAFNVFNHPNFTNIAAFLGEPNFGQAQFQQATVGVPNQLYATGSPRSWQFMLKLQF